MSAAKRTTQAVLTRAGLGRPGPGRPPTVLRRLGRADLPDLCRSLAFVAGAEIGVWKGAYAAAFCRANPALHMRCVDPWISYPAWKDTKNKLDPAEAAALIEDARTEAEARLTPLNASIIRKFSADAVAEVLDGSLDFVYIDGNHVYDAVLEDVTLWAPKVRAGGFVAGHDYRHFTNKPTIHVIEAVNDYTTRHAIAPWFVLAADRTPSFLWVKS